MTTTVTIADNASMELVKLSEPIVARSMNKALIADTMNNA